MKYIILSISIMMSLTAFGQNGDNHRNINWVHGFVGSSASWENFDNYFTGQFDITSNRVSYSSKGGIVACAEDCMSQMIKGGENPIAVGHSMGGLVLRQVYELDDSYFNGYITFGTPHEGAYFANSYLNGDVEIFMRDFVDEVFADVLESVFTPLGTSISTLLHGIFGFDDPQALGQYVFDFIEHKIKNLTDDLTISDMKVGGDYINNLSHPDLPLVNFYGSEDSPVHWRFLHSFTEVGSDDVLVKKMDKLRRNYELLYNVALVTSVSCASFGFINPSCYLIAIYSAQIAVQLQEAIQTMDQSEAAWLALIGSSTGSYEDCYTETIVVGYDYNHNGGYNDDYDLHIRDSCLQVPYPKLLDSLLIEFGAGPCDTLDYRGTPDSLKSTSGDRRPGICDDYSVLTRDVLICNTIYIFDKSDGLVPYRATAEPSNIEWVELPHLNHQELRRHKASKDQLEDLFRNVNYFYDQGSPDKYSYFQLKIN